MSASGAREDGEFELACRAVELGWLTKEQVEAAVLEAERSPGSGLLSRLPLSPQQLSDLAGVATRHLPSDVAATMTDARKRVGKYVVTAPLGAGGMGIVVKAYDLELRRWVALKFMKGIGDERAVTYFRREAELAAQLAHPNIAAIYEVGEHEKQPFIAMQLIDGDHLHAARKKMTLAQLLEAVRAVADAVKAAHDRNIIHRDLKPSNVMVDGSGHVFVMDFGLAKETSIEGQSLTGTNAVLGTPNYMAPEQAKGRADRQSDVYGIGAILYELVTGRPPFTGETAADVLVQVLDADVVWPRKLNPGLPADVEAIILKCLERNPALRYQDAGQLLQDLAAFQQGEPLRHARRPTLGYVLARKLRRQPWLWGTAAALVLALAGGITYGLYSFVETRRARNEAQRLLARIYIDRAEEAYKDHDVTQQAVFLAAARGEDPTSVPEPVVLDLADRMGGLVWSVKFREQLRCAAVAPDQQTLIVGGQGGLLSERESLTGRELRRFEGHTGDVFRVAYSPDGRRFASAAADLTIRIWELGTGAAARVLQGHKRFVTSVAFSPDGTRLYSTSDDRTFVAWDPEKDTRLFSIMGHEGGVNMVAISPDGTQLATGGDDRYVRIWDAWTGDEIRGEGGLDGIKKQEQDVARVCFTPDGHELLSAGGDATVREWWRAGPRVLSRGHEGSVDALAVTPDGRSVLTGGADQTVRRWDLVSGEELDRWRCHRAWVKEVLPLGDGDYVLSCGYDGLLQLWALPTSDDSRDLKGHQFVVRAASFSPDGRRLLTCGDDRTLRLWDALTGRELSFWGGDQGPQTAVAISPDGRWAVSGSQDERVRLWSTESARENHEATKVLEGVHSSLVWCVAISPDGRWALSGGADHKVVLWDLADPRGARHHADFVGHKSVVNTVAFSPDGRTALSGSDDNTAILWKIPGGRPLARLPDHRGRVRSVAFHPDGRRFITAAWEDDLQLWDASTPDRPVRRFSGHRGGANTAAFTPDGRWLASGGMDGTVRLWNLDSGLEERRLPAHNGRVYGLAVSPDGGRMVTCGLWGRVRLWDLDRILRVRDEGGASGPRAVQELVQARAGLKVAGSNVEPMSPEELSEARGAAGMRVPRQESLGPVLSRIRDYYSGDFPSWWDRTHGVALGPDREKWSRNWSAHWDEGVAGRGEEATAWIELWLETRPWRRRADEDWWAVHRPRVEGHLRRLGVDGAYAAWWDRAFGERLKTGTPWHELWSRGR